MLGAFRIGQALFDRFRSKEAADHEVPCIRRGEIGCDGINGPKLNLKARIAGKVECGRHLSRAGDRVGIMRGSVVQPAAGHRTAADGPRGARREILGAIEQPTETGAWVIQSLR